MPTNESKLEIECSQCGGSCQERYFKSKDAMQLNKRVCHVCCTALDDAVGFYRPHLSLVVKRPEVLRSLIKLNLRRLRLRHLVLEFCLLGVHLLGHLLNRQVQLLDSRVVRSLVLLKRLIVGPSRKCSKFQAAGLNSRHGGITQEREVLFDKRESKNKRGSNMCWMTRLALTTVIPLSRWGALDPDTPEDKVLAGDFCQALPSYPPPFDATPAPTAPAPPGSSSSAA